MDPILTGFLLGIEGSVRVYSRAIRNTHLVSFGYLAYSHDLLFLVSIETPVIIRSEPGMRREYSIVLL